MSFINSKAMWLLVASVILLIVVIGFIVVANLPSASASSEDSPCGCGKGCPRCPCQRCGVPKRRCGCGPQGGAGGCPFC